MIIVGKQNRWFDALYCFAGLSWAVFSMEVSRKYSISMGWLGLRFFEDILRAICLIVIKGACSDVVVWNSTITLFSWRCMTNDKFCRSLQI
jgi:hypothetical protein